MSAWDSEYLNEEVQAFIEFDENSSGSFQFGYVQGQIDYHSVRQDGKPAVEFSWEGGDGADGTPLTGSVISGTKPTRNSSWHAQPGDD